MLSGEYNHSIDTKGRINVPAKLRNELGDSFVMCKGLDKCISVYSKEAWEDVSKKLMSLPTTDRNARRFSRFIIGSAIECTPDKQGRTKLSASLIEYAGIKKDIVVVGMITRLEIWDKEKWDEYNNVSDACMEDVSQEMFEVGINL